MPSLWTSGCRRALGGAGRVCARPRPVRVLAGAGSGSRPGGTPRGTESARRVARCFECTDRTVLGAAALPRALSQHRIRSFDNVGRPGVVRPADPGVTRLLMPTLRAKADDPQNTVARRCDPVAHLATGSTRPAQRMPRGDHRLPAFPRHLVPDRNQADRAKILQGTAHIAIRRRQGSHGPARRYTRSRWRQLDAQPACKARKHLARRGHRQHPGTAPPVQTLAQATRQTAAAGIRESALVWTHASV